jgi:hypothetical protein
MDQPEKKIYHNLTLAEAKVLERLVEEIKKLITKKGKKVFSRTHRGRPRAYEPVQTFPITKPSNIPKRKRLKLSRKEFVQKRIERYKDLVNEYKQLLLLRFRNSSLGALSFIHNIKDITLFFRGCLIKLKIS